LLYVVGLLVTQRSRDYPTGARRWCFVLYR